MGKVFFVIADHPYNMKYRRKLDRLSYEFLMSKDMSDFVEVKSQLLPAVANTHVFLSWNQVQNRRKRPSCRKKGWFLN